MNSVLIAILVMVILSLCRLNVILALFIGALAGGLISGMGVNEVIGVFTGGIVNGAEIALSYALLGGFAALIAYSGITDVMVNKILSLLNASKTAKARVIAKVSIIATLLVISIISQNLVPVHIAFIPILIPPLISLFNELQLDRRLLAVVMTFGLTFTYAVLPFGYGQIFQNTIVTSFANAGVTIEFSDVAPNMIIPALGFVIGLILAFFYFSKPRKYLNKESDLSSERLTVSAKTIITAVIAILVTFIVQFFTDSMIFGALGGIMVFFLSMQFKWAELDRELVNGIKIMAYIGMVMLAANGFAGVITETEDVLPLVSSISDSLGNNKAFIVMGMMVVGLVVTMGIGSSFATLPIIGAIFVPMGAELGLSIAAIIAIVGTAGVLGDAGSPASDSTLGPTAGLNIDGQHDHIWDTCVPTFVFLNIPVVITGFIAGMIL
ncbi:TRAP transporter large permease subunit [Jeotgalicoccus nanhaiensis]|uniref:TRAP transporter large permease subunit n=2 Tax=Jeotgalicoccus nanhaiensis TaxID=568603 RepID=A0ABR9XZA9_9STAP|nr:TRAP transporter large permease subunit [Jeotgalicoccus nanhaiensis]TFU62064.1 TRAP transporter large permease subunit [Jeotgalicoccus nanhaiensis]